MTLKPQREINAPAHSNPAFHAEGSRLTMLGAVGHSFKRTGVIRYISMRARLQVRALRMHLFGEEEGGTGVLNGLSISGGVSR